MTQAPRFRLRLRCPRPGWVVVSALVVGLACAGVRQEPVSPTEIPELEQRLSNDPDNGALLQRYASALYAADRCDSARAVARRSRVRRPADATGPLIEGQCLEKGGEFGQAVGVYREFLASHPDVPGAPAVRAREMIASRAGARVRAREALQRESELAGQPPNPEVVAVLPLEISGDSTYLPLGRGLAQMLISDLALLRRFPLVERLQLDALLGELALTQTGRIETETSARIGHLVQAGRLVQGLAVIPPTGDVRLEAGVVQTSGEVMAPAVTTGRLPELLQLEKALVLSLTRRLGYQLSAAERQLILENGTQDLLAFLAYSRGLLEEDRGNYGAAAELYAEAARRDPKFREAKERHQAAAAAPFALQLSAAQLPALASLTVPDPAAPTAITPGVSAPATSGAVSTGLGDLASTHSEQLAPQGVQQTTQQAANSPISRPPPSTVIPPEVTGRIRIIIRIP